MSKISDNKGSFTIAVAAMMVVQDRLLGASNLNLHCDVLVDSSMRSRLDLSTTVGSIIVNTTNPYRI